MSELSIEELASISRAYHENYDAIKRAAVEYSLEHSGIATAKLFGISATSIVLYRRDAGIMSKPYKLRDQNVISAYKVYQILKRKIESGELKEGTKLSTAEIASQYDLTRSSVDQLVFARLKDDGLVWSKQRQGTFVKKRG